MLRNPVRFLLTAVLTAVLIDLLFWDKPAGLNYLIWVAFILAGLLFLLISEKVRPAKINLLLVLPILGLAAAAFTRLEGLTVFFGIALSLLGLMLLAATTRTGNWVCYRVWDYVKAFSLVVFSGSTRAVSLFRRPPAVEGQAQNSSVQKRGFKAVLPVLGGLLLAFPLILVLTALLSSADPIFADRMKDLLSIFDIDRLPEYLFRGFYVLVFAYVFVGVYLHAVLPQREEPRTDPQQPWMKPFLGWTQASIVLLSVNALFAFFVAIQFQYFFGGEKNINLSGYTYSEYAVKGFEELVAVAIISLALYLGVATIARRETSARQRMFSILSIVLMGLVLVMLLSAWQRLGLYEQVYGFSRLRTYTHIFIPWLGVLLAAVILLEVLKRRGHFALVLLAVVVGFGLTFPILNVDAFIARENITRGNRGLEFDGNYLKQLSADAVPVMFDAYQDASLRSEVKDTLGAELACRAAMTAAEEARPWVGLNLSDQRARNILADNTAAWSQFAVRNNDREYPYWEVNKNGTWQDCWMQSFD